jgi:hypothetical protein
MHKFPGGLTARVTPVPIPNTEVKPCRADDTALETTRERRSPPGLKIQRPQRHKRCGLFYFVLNVLVGFIADEEWRKKKSPARELS